MKESVEQLNEALKAKPAQEVIAYFIREYAGKVVLGSSLGAEDQVLTEMIVNIDRNTRIFTLDTGRLFQETFKVLEETNKKYRINIEVYFPDKEKVENMVMEKGVNLFYKSVENRKLCCHIRKVEPGKRALKDAEIWITGIRKDQSINRFYNKLVEWDEENEMIKVNPLINWTEKDVWNYIREKEIPYNELHDKGYPSIGCLPCTRAVRKGEDIRAGRWWWEEPENSECGLHMNGNEIKK